MTGDIPRVSMTGQRDCDGSGARPVEHENNGHDDSEDNVIGDLYVLTASMFSTSIFS